MPRIRTLKPEHRTHRKIGPLDHITYRLWVGMILESDDHGRLVCDTEQLRVTIFGYHPKVSRAIVEAAVRTLEAVGLVKLYLVEGNRYAWFPSWRDHQRIDHATESKLPPYNDSPIPREESASPRESSRRIGSYLDLDLDRKGSRIGREALSAPAPEPSGIQFQIPDSIQQALSRSPVLGAVARLRQPTWWQAQVRANGRRGIDFAAEVLNAEAWITTNPDRAPRKDHSRFLHRWFARAEAPHA